MFVRQTKRTIYDENGNLYKMDQLRSIRRKEAPPSVIEDQQEESIKSITQSSDKQPSSNTLKVISLLLVLLMLYVGVNMLPGLVRGDEAIFEMSGKSNKYFQSPLSLSQLQQRLSMVFPSEHPSQVQCSLQANNTATCHFNLNLPSPHQ